MSDLRRAIALMDSKQFVAALPLLQSALRRSEQKPGGPSSAEMADILDIIGDCYDGQNDFWAASTHYRRAATISRYGFEERICSSFKAATSFFNLRNFAEADKDNANSLSMIAAERAVGSTASALLNEYRAKTLALSANIMRDSGRFSEALPPLEENLAFYESVGDTEQLIACLASLGEIYFSQGLSEKALAIAQRAQSLNPSSGESLTDLSRLWTMVKRHEEALTCAKKALECEERVHGKNTHNYAVLQERVGSAYAKLCQIDTARGIIEPVWDMKSLTLLIRLGLRNC